MLSLFTGSNILFETGIVLVVLSVIGTIVSTVVLRISGKRLRAKLEEEFGKKRR